MKNHKLLIISILYLFPFVNFAQTDSLALSFIPEGYVLMDTLSGDLNLDKYPDKLLIVRKIEEDTIYEIVDRPLLILLGQAEGMYRLAARCDKAVLCYRCGGVYGDPYAEMAIQNGIFTIHHYGGSNWRWTRAISFKYSPKDQQWYLYEDGGETFFVFEPDKTESKVKTTQDFGIIKFEDFEY
jgi:hypothetical protein